MGTTTNKNDLMDKLSKADKKQFDDMEFQKRIREKEEAERITRSKIPSARRQNRANKKLGKKANQYCIRLCTQFLKEVKKEGYTFEDEEVLSIYDKYEKHWKHWLKTKGAKGTTEANAMFSNYLRMFTEQTEKQQAAKQTKVPVGTTPKLVKKKTRRTKPQAKK